MIARFNYSLSLGKIRLQAGEYGITEVKFVDRSEKNNLNPNYLLIKNTVR